MNPAFSHRTGWDTSESILSAAVRAAQDAGHHLYDLTLANPTRCGFHYDSAAILGPLSNAAGLRYDPQPMGLLSARSAVSHYYFDHGADVPPETIVLTTSTSEAYSFLFRLLCDPGDEVLVAQPGYPLFDFVANLENVQLKYYNLFQDFGWWIDFHSLERQVSTRTRAVILVHPNNPTGHPTSVAQRDALEDFCVLHNLSLIVDEVFLDFGNDAPISSFAVGEHRCNTFVVSGISKIAALPQMKVGWIAAFGPPQVTTRALNRLEIIADTFLSMNTPAQLALPAWLEGRHAIQAQIKDRVRFNLALLNDCRSLTTLPTLAGWSAIVRLPGLSPQPLLAERLVRQASVITHPGSLYGIAEPNRLVVSLILAPQTLTGGLDALNRWCESEQLTPSDQHSGQRSADSGNLHR